MDRTPTVRDVYRLGSRPRSRRWLLRAGLTGAGAGLLLGAASPFAGGLAAGGRSEYGELGLDPRLMSFPRLVFRLTAERIEAPPIVAAGTVVLVEENLEADPGHAFVFRLPDDVSETEIAAALSPDAPPATEETPEWFWRSTFSGSPDRAAASGGRAFALVDLSPGRYIVGNAYRPPAEFARFEVVAPSATPVAVPDLAADLTADMREMAFDMPSTVRSGVGLWRVRNVGAMLHEIAIMPVPAGATVDQVQQALGAILEAEAAGADFEEQTAPASLGAAWAGWTPDLVAGVGVTSPQGSVLAQIDLAPGSYAAVCFVPDPVTFTPHLMMGMVAVFAVVA